LPVLRVIFTHGGVRFRTTERPLAVDHEIAVGRDGHIQWAAFRIVDHLSVDRRLVVTKYGDGIVASAGRSDPGAQIEPAVQAEGDTSRIRDDVV
jgi:hypothetical protein